MCLRKFNVILVNYMLMAVVVGVSVVIYVRIVVVAKTHALRLLTRETSFDKLKMLLIAQMLKQMRVRNSFEWFTRLDKKKCGVPRM